MPADATHERRITRLENDTAALYDMVGEIQRVQREHSTAFAEHGATLAEHGATLAEHSEALSKIQGTVDQHTEMLAEILRRLPEAS